MCQHGKMSEKAKEKKKKYIIRTHMYQHRKYVHNLHVYRCLFKKSPKASSRVEFEEKDCMKIYTNTFR